MATNGPTTWDFRDLAGARLGVYSRASKDEDEREKSVTDQMSEGEQWADRHGCVVAARYAADNNKSASRFGLKSREDFTRLLGDIEAGKLDGVWFWDLSRSQRRLDVYARLRDLCRDKGVFWVVAGRPYDLNNYMDLQALGYDAVNNEAFSERLSANVKRGVKGSAAMGRPAGRLNYGYRRVYDDRGRYVEQLPDDRSEEVTSEDGATVQYSKAAVVEEIFKRIARGESLTKISKILNGRGIPAPTSAGPWTQGMIRSLVMRPAYIGQRVHQGKVVDFPEPCWKPLVSAEVFHAAQNILTSRAVSGTKPARGRHLLSFIARCAVCGAVMAAQHVGSTERPTLYQCNGPRRCATIREDWLDVFAEKMIVRYLSREDVYQSLMAARVDDAEITEARAEAARLRGEVETWRRLSASGEADAVTATRSINGLLARIEEEDEKAGQAQVPPVLRGRIGPGASAAWSEIDDIAIKRQMFRICADIRVMRIGKSGAKCVPAEDRTIWTWSLGPAKQEPPEPSNEVVTATPGDVDRLMIQKARRIFQDDLANGKVPPVRVLQKTLHIGMPRVKIVRAALAAEALQR